MLKLYQRCLRQIKKGSFGNNIIQLFSGTALSQIILLLASPILTRIYNPADFGSFAMYSAVVALGSGFITARYELALLLPKSEQKARILLYLCNILAVAVSIIMLLVILILYDKIENLPKLKDIKELILYLPVSVLVSALIQTYINWGLRGKRFKLISTSRVSQSISTIAIQFIVGFFFNAGGIGLILGQFIGQLISIASLCRGQKERSLSILKVDRRRLIHKIKIVAHQYKSFPKYMLLAGVINKITNYVPLFIFGWVYSTAIVGFFAMAQRIIQAPMTLIGGNIADAYFQKASELAKVDFILLRKKSLQLLSVFFVVGTLPVMVVILFGPMLLNFFLGNEWEQIGRYVQIMAIYLWIQFAVTPLARLFTILEAQNLYQRLEWIRLILCVLGTFLGAFTFGPLGAVTCFSISMAIGYIIVGIFVFQILNQKCKFKTE